MVLKCIFKGWVGFVACMYNSWACVLFLNYQDTSTPSWSLLEGELTQKSKLKDWDRSSESDNHDPDNSDSDI